MIQMFHVYKTFGRDVEALVDVSFHVEKGEFALLAGPSGAGKTTLLRLIYRDELPTAGQILVNGRNVVKLPGRHIPYLRRSIGVVFQDFKLLKDRTVFENLALVARAVGMPAAAGRRRRLPGSRPGCRRSRSPPGRRARSRRRRCGSRTAPRLP